jgi:hypothetical protein
MSGAAGKLTPIVTVAQVEHVLLVPRMTTIPAQELRDSRGNLASHREHIVAALDYLFLGL